MRKCDKLAQIARTYIGTPYVFATSGATCTPALRRERAAAKPDYAANIKKYCPVLSGKQATCDGCKYKGMPAHDCRGLTYKAAKQAGLTISSVGATSQYNTDSWAEKDEIAKMPKDTPCMVFKRATDGKTMSHTGIYLGDGTVVDCRGHASGTVHNALSSYPWTHYAIAKGSYDAVDNTAVVTPPTVGEIPQTLPRTLRNGYKGSDVVALQTMLLDLGYQLPRFGADGTYGTETVNAVKAYQATAGLVVDGICGAKTWTALYDAVQADPEDGEDDVTVYTVTITGLDLTAVNQLLSIYPTAKSVESN